MPLHSFGHSEYCPQLAGFNDSIHRVHFTLIGEHTILLNQTEVTIDSLLLTLRGHIESYGSKHELVLHSSASTHYAHYVDAQNAIHNLYIDLRNEKALVVFGLPFADITKEEQSSIIKEIPKRLRHTLDQN